MSYFTSIEDFLAELCSRGDNYRYVNATNSLWGLDEKQNLYIKETNNKIIYRGQAKIMLQRPNTSFVYVEDQDEEKEDRVTIYKTTTAQKMKVTNEIVFK